MLTEGMKSSEFIKSLLAFIAGLVMIWYGSKTNNTMLIEWGTILTGGTSIGYSLSRGLAKQGNASPYPAPAEPKAPLSPEEAAKVVGGLK